MLEFFTNENKLGNSDGDISNFVKIGNGLIKLFHDNGEDKLIASSLINEDSVVDISSNLAHIGGIPLSSSLCSDENLDPSGNDSIGLFYALDVIISYEAENITNPFTPKPMANGTEVGVHKTGNFHYFKTYLDVSSPSSPTGLINIGGLPMAYGDDNELILRDSGYVISDVDPDRYLELNFFGTPVRVGMVNNENKYFLIASAV